MKTKTFLITAMLATMVGALMTSGVTYGVFSDTETSTGIMTINCDYWVMPDGWMTEPDTFLDMKKCKQDGITPTGGTQGTFGYNDSNYKFFYNFTGKVDYADQHDISDKVWALIIYEPPNLYTLIDTNRTDSTTSPYKDLTFEGSIELNRDLINATVYIIDFDAYNGTYTEIPAVHSMISDGFVNYHDINKG